MRVVAGLLVLLGTDLAADPGNLPPPDDDQWTMPGHDYAGTRYSTFAAITLANAARLRHVWSGQGSLSANGDGAR